MAVLITACFVAVLSLRSQSAASYPTYFLAILMLLTLHGWRDVFRIGLVRFVLALLVWLSLSTFWSEGFALREATSVWTRALLVCFFVIAVAECQLRGQMQRWLSIAITVVGTVAVLVAIINFVLTQPEDGRLNGMGQLDTHVVAALVYGVVLMFVIRTGMENRSRVWQLVCVLAIVAIVCAIYLSDSRNAWVSVTIGVAAYLVAIRVSDWRQFVLTVTAVGLLLGIGLLLIASNELTRDLLLPRGDSFRLAIWQSTWQSFLSDSVLFGRGILTDDDIVVEGIGFPHPHNMYLAVLFQGGVIALLLYTVVLFKTLAVLLHNFDNRDAKFALGILAIGLTSHILDGHELIDKVSDTWLLVWLPVGLAIGLSWKPFSRQGLT